MQATKERIIEDNPAVKNFAMSIVNTVGAPLGKTTKS